MVTTGQIGDTVCVVLRKTLGKKSMSNRASVTGILLISSFYFPISVGAGASTPRANVATAAPCVVTTTPGTPTVVTTSTGSPTTDSTQYSTSHSFTTDLGTPTTTSYTTDLGTPTTTSYTTNPGTPVVTTHRTTKTTSYGTP